MIIETTTELVGAQTQFLPRPGAASFKRLLGSMPALCKQPGRILLGEDHLLESSRGVARRLSKTSFDEGQGRLVPATDFEVVRNVLGEVDQGTHDRAIVGWSDFHRGHRSDLCANEALGDASR